ncbi:MAG: LptF/LptG family permease [Opitutales bacterium]|nr:LptF/LptG family permease [Opitutales bacterium]
MILKRYVFAEWIKVFAITTAVVVGLVLVQEVYSKLDGLLSKGAQLWEILFSLSLSIPSALPSILPVVLLISVLFSVGVLHRKNEITAIKAAGMSLGVVASPLMMGAGLCAVLILLMNAVWIPWSVAAEDDLRRRIALRSASESEDGGSAPVGGSVDNLGFINFHEGRLWLIGQYFPMESKGASVSVFERDNEGREQRRIVASRARYLGDESGWVFEEGRELFFDGVSREPYRSRPFERLEQPGFREEPEVMLALRAKPHEIPFSLLQRVLSEYAGQDSPEILPYRVRLYRMLLSPLSCFLVVGFALPFVASGVRANPMIGISKAFGMFLLYFLVSSIANILGARAWVSPPVAALIPLLFIGLASIPIYLKAR